MKQDAGVSSANTFAVSDEERWWTFRYEYIETGWFDYDRYKTIQAMQKLCYRVPDDVLDDLPNLTVFAPSTAILGHVMPSGAGNCVFLYLAPSLERKSQAEVDFTVAHEFAHVVLGHYKPGATTLPAECMVSYHGDAPSERAADSLAESWGFPRPRLKAKDRAIKSGIQSDRVNE
ncbi:MAG TPA: hypothetical protein VN577_05020 [Terriglobales bacterium]|nr:hypothetical protein [Terriglobales bacterium]